MLLSNNKQNFYRAITMCILGALFYYYEYYLRVAPSAITAELTNYYNISIAELGHLVACYSYAYVLVQIPVGIMMDRFGPRKMLTMACLACAMGTYIFISSDSFLLGQLSRFMIGFGSAFAYVGVLKMATLWLPRQYFAVVVGICTSLGIAGGLSGTILMTHLVDVFGWQQSLYYSAGIGILLSILLWIWIKEQDSVIVAATTTTTATTRIRILPNLITIIKIPTIWINGFIGCLTYIPISMFADMWAIPYFKTLGLDRNAAAWGASLIYIGFGIGGPLWGIISSKLQSRRIPLITGAFCAAIIAIIILCSENMTLVNMQVLLFLLGLFSAAEILVFAVTNDIVTKNISATALSFTNMIIMLSAAVLIPFVGMVLNYIGQEYFTLALGIMPILLVIAGLLSIILKETYHNYPVTPNNPHLTRSRLRRAHPLPRSGEGNVDAI